MTKWIRSALLVALSAAILTYVFERYRTLQLLISNADPSQLPVSSALGHHTVLFADKIRNCEDAVLDEDRGIAYLSCDPGRDHWNTVLGVFKDPAWKTGSIYYYEYAKHSKEDPGTLGTLEITGWHPDARDRFHPLGIEIHPSSGSLFVVNHDPTGTVIEQLQLGPDGRSATHKRTIKHGLLNTPNSITALGQSELLVTNDHHFAVRTHWALSRLETYLTIPIGSVVHLDLKTDQARVLTKMALPNGITQLNGTHLAVSSTSTNWVHIYAMDRQTRALTLRTKIGVPFFPDNLSVDSNGKLLIAGHPHPRPIDIVAFNSHRYNLDGDSASANGLLPEAGRSRAGSWVSEWDGNEAGKVKDLYVGTEFMTVCSAVRDVKRGVGLMAGLYDKGLLVWRE